MTHILRLVNLDTALLSPVLELQTELNFQLSTEPGIGYEVIVKGISKGLVVRVREEQAELFYHRKAEFFRGLGLLIEALEYRELGDLQEIPAFPHLTYMQDNSRNAVCNITSVKKTIRQLALMGYDSLMLYTEDTYEIKEYPYFGYMRGRYSKEELEECNAYALSYGVELIPCIQTLAHLNAIFHWGAFDEVRDLGDILLCNHDKTYELIEAMVRTCSQVYTSRRINIGMDEAEQLGLGKYLKVNGYTERTEIMMQHLKKVVELCKKYDFQVMMWSDMFFKMLPNNSDYYNLTTDISVQIKDMIPSGVQLIYWDYYSRDKSKYDKMLERHSTLSDAIGFAGGAWKWQGFAPLLHHSMMISKLALQSCKEQKVTDVIVTGWGDNGAECSSFVVGPVLQLYAEYCYRGVDTEEQVARRLKTCTHMEYKDFMQLDSVNLTPDNPSPGRISVGPAKYLFYQDLLMGLYDKHVDQETYPKHFEECYRTLSEIAAKGTQYSYLFDTLSKLAHVLTLKCDMGIRLKKAYDEKDSVTLSKIAGEECPELISRVEVFHNALRTQWYHECKPFGFDVQGIRIGGLKERIRDVTWSVERYLEGKLDRIEELEQERLLLDHRENPGYRTLPLYHNDWSSMVTASVL
jgi:hypothetical protein